MIPNRGGAGVFFTSFFFYSKLSGERNHIHVVSRLFITSSNFLFRAPTQKLAFIS